MYFSKYSFYKTLIAISMLFIVLATYEMSVAKRPTGLANSDWPMYQYDVRHSGQSPLSGVTSTPWVLWKTQIPYRGYGMGEDGTGMMKANDSTIYLTASGALYAINLRNGTIKWGSQFYSVHSRSTPSLGDDGKLYWGFDDTFVAISDTGQIAWGWTNLSGNGIFGSSLAISADGSIYFGHEALWAFSQDGSFKWYFPFQSYNQVSPVISSDGTIFAGDFAKLYAINPNGSLKWSADIGVGAPSPAIDGNGNIYVGTGLAKVFAFAPDGTQKWIYTADESIYDQWGDWAGFNTPPAIGLDGTIYLATYYQGGVTNTLHLYALNPDGSLKWKTPFPGGNPIASGSTAPVVDKFNRIFVCRGSFLSDGTCYAFDSNGIVLWEFETGSSVRTSPLIVSNGIILVQNMDDAIYALGDNSIPRPYVTPLDLNWVVEQGSTPFTATIQITSTLKPITWTANITIPTNWVSIPITRNTTPSQLRLTINPTLLSVGTYSTNIIIDSDLGGIVDSRIILPITLTVVTPPPVHRNYLPYIRK